MATLTLNERIRRLQEDPAYVLRRVTQACRVATMRAVEKATELTPPTENDLRGTNTRTGEMKQHWATDSKTEPRIEGDNFVTELNNDKEYASYVNDGHRMDRHFVPGLYINPHNGMLEYDPGADVGIVVGTRTPYVPGLFMVDQAEQVYHEVLRQELADLGEVFE